MEVMMKQTKRITRNQRSFLQKKGIDTRGVRVVEETKSYITVQFPDGNIFKYSKEV